MKFSDLMGLTPKPAARKKPPAAMPTETKSPVNSKAVKYPGSPYAIIFPEPVKVEKTNYFQARTLPQLEEFLRKCAEKKICSFDYETAPNEVSRAAFKVLKTQFSTRKKNIEKDYEAECNHALHIYNENLKEMPEMTEKQIIKHQDKLKSDLNKSRAKIEKEYAKKFQQLDKEYQSEKAVFLKVPLDPHQAEVCTISLCCEPGEVCVVFMGMLNGSGISATKADVFDLFAKYILENDQIEKIAYNLSFETGFTHTHKKSLIEPLIDPFILLVRCMQIIMPGKIADPKSPTTGKGLKPMTKLFLNHTMSDFRTVLDAAGVEFFDEMHADSEDALDYAAEDADYTLRLFYFWKEIALQIPIENGKKFKNYYEWLYAVEMPFSRIIGAMQYNGLRWNEKLSHKRKLEAAFQIEEAQNHIKTIAQEFGHEIEPGSNGKTKDIHNFVFNVLCLPEAEISEKTGKPSLDSNAIFDIKYMLENRLENLEEEEELYRHPEHAVKIMERSFHPYKDQGIELLNAMLRLQKYQTLMATHIEGREKYLHPVTKRIHTNYTPWTETSRLNSRNPNQQNTPRSSNDELQTRDFIIADEGELLYLIDFSGFELRLMAYYSNDETMIKAFNENGDLHKLTACRMTGKSPEDITKEERNNAKAGNFGINYGGTEYALRHTFKKMGIRKSLEECAAIVRAVKDTYPRITDYQENSILEARKKGFVDTIYGYKRLLKDINSGYRPFRAADERRAGNTPIQGSAADIMKYCQNKTYEMIFKKGWSQKVRILAQIHDEQILAVPADKEFLIELDREVKSIMEEQPVEGFPVPIIAESSLAEIWGQKKDFDKFIKEYFGE